jgi:hypothetical protein
MASPASASVFSAFGGFGGLDWAATGAAHNTMASGISDRYFTAET